MSGTKRLLSVAALLFAVAVVWALKQSNTGAESEALSSSQPAGTNDETGARVHAPVDQEALPRLVDLGADQCVPCKMMAPILEELSKECADTFDVEFIDVWKNPKAGEEYGIRMIPTQIFYDAEGNELFRHEGFFGKEEILAKWQEYGVTAARDSED